MISSSSSLASSNSSLAAGCSRMAGYLPFSSQARKKNCQSMSSRSRRRSGSTSLRAGERRYREVVEADLLLVGLRLPQRQQRPPLLAACSVRSRSWSARLASSSLADRTGSSRSDTTPTTRDASSTCTVGLVVGRRDPDRGVLPRGGRAADQQRQRHAAPLHLLGHADHLVQRRRDQPGQPDGAGALGDRRVQDRRGRDHDAEVDDLVVVAAEHDADDVLADVVHVALDRGEHDLALRAAAAALGSAAPVPSSQPALCLLLLGLHEGLQVGDGALHRPRALDHLGQEHLAGAEQVADDLHAVHQRALDDVERPVGDAAWPPRCRPR